MTHQYPLAATIQKDISDTCSHRLIKILHITSDLQIHGKSILLYNFIHHLKNGLENKILVLNWPGALKDRFLESNIQVLSCGLGESLFHLVTRRSVYNDIAAYKPDICFCWSGAANLASSAARLFGIPVIWSIHNTNRDWQQLKDRIAIRITAAASHFVPNSIICCSHATKEVYINYHKYSKSKLVVIENGIDTQKFRPNKKIKMRIRKLLKIPETAILIASATRAPEKKEMGGVDKDLNTLLDAAAIVRRKRANIYLIIFGPNLNYENEALVEAVTERGLHDRLYLLGYRNDVADLFAAADIVTMSSASGEGFGLALIEGMACGAIPVCTDCGEMKRIVGGVGMVVPPKMPHALADAILSISDKNVKERNRISSLAIERARNRYSIEKMAEQYKTLIFDTLGSMYK